MDQLANIWGIACLISGVFFGITMLMLVFGDKYSNKTNMTFFALFGFVFCISLVNLTLYISHM